MGTATGRFNGTLKKWNQDRGFGFLEADPGGPEVFVHISAFPRDGLLPTPGEALTFEVEQDREGRKRAVRVRRPGSPVPTDAGPARRPSTAKPGPASTHPPARRPHRARTHHRSAPAWFGRGLTLAFLAGVGWFGYGAFEQRQLRAPLEPAVAVDASAPAPLVPRAPAALFQCDGRLHCSQMTSCQEARLFLKNCPGTQMDGDGDGVPCEGQWC